MMKRFIQILFCTLYFFLAILPAHSAVTKVGTAFFKPPFVISPGQGFDITLINTLCKRLNLTCQLIPMDYDKLFSAMQEGQLDLAISGISISSSRQKKFIFSIPYMLSQGQFLILNNATFQPADIPTMKVGIIKAGEGDGVFYQYLIHRYPNLKIIQYDDGEDLITALTTGDIDTAFAHKESLNYWLVNGGGQFKKLGQPIIVGEGIGVMASPRNAALIELINQQLILLKNDRNYIQLFNTYFGKQFN